MSLPPEHTQQLFHRPTYAEVSLNALRDNLHAIQSLVGSAKVMAVVKSNGYGHGLEVTARTLESVGA